MDAMIAYEYLMVFIFIFSLFNLLSAIIGRGMFYFGRFYYRGDSYYLTVIVSHIVLLFYSLYMIFDFQ